MIDPCKSNLTNPTVKHEQFQRANHSDLCKEISDKYCSMKDLSLQSMKRDVINAKEILYTSNEIENSKKHVEKYDIFTPENSMTQQLEYISWKYKNPHNVSIDNYMNYKKSTLDNIFKDDEPQEGRRKRNILFHCREYLATYQESCGTPRTEYSFAALIIVMAQTMAQTLLALTYMIVNIVPIIQMFSFILRFILDKIIDISRFKSLQQLIIKFTIFIVQLLSVYICLVFIFGFIVWPVIQMAITIATKFLMCN